MIRRLLKRAALFVFGCDDDGLLTELSGPSMEEVEQIKAELEAADVDRGLPVGVPPVTFSPRAVEMLTEPKRYAEAVREANKPAVNGPLKGSIEWRIQEAKKKTGLT